MDNRRFSGEYVNAGTLSGRASRSRFSLPLLTRVSPVASYYHLLPELSDEQQLQWALLDTHDGLTDYYKHLRTEWEIVTCLQALGLTNIWSNQGGNGVEARGTRPLE